MFKAIVEWFRDFFEDKQCPFADPEDYMNGIAVCHPSVRHCDNCIVPETNKRKTPKVRGVLLLW
jgi:hypothetical protein